MERDFFGLSSKNGAGTLREDAADKLKDPAAVRGVGLQWSFSNKVSALPQLLSFKATQEDRPRKTIVDPLSSTGYMTISNANAFVSNQKPFLGVNAIQKKLTIGKQEENRHGVTVYHPLQRFDAHSACSQETRIFSAPNQSNLATTVLQSNLAITGQNMVNSVTKPLALGGASLIAPMSVLPSSSSIVGSTDLRNSSKSCGQRAQLTIFYNGSVCVYDDISPEMAQAVMLLAGNESTTPIQNKTTVSTSKLQPQISMTSKGDGFIISQSYPSPIPGPLSVTSHASNFQLGGRSLSDNELAIVRPVGSSATPSNHLKSPNNDVGSVGSVAVKMVPPVGLPQARKASLARFLEKRKERVMRTSPYYMSKKSPECSTPISDGVTVNFSINSSGSCPLPAVN